MAFWELWRGFWDDRRNGKRGMNKQVLATICVGELDETVLIPVDPHARLLAAPAGERDACVTETAEDVSHANVPAIARSLLRLLGQWKSCSLITYG
jgi:hypothetical protein